MQQRRGTTLRENRLIDDDNVGSIDGPYSSQRKSGNGVFKNQLGQSGTYDQAPPQNGDHTYERTGSQDFNQAMLTQRLGTNEF